MTPPPDPMQIFHLGLHKTGTTSLQKNLFAAGDLPYQGLHGTGWDLHRQDWLDFFIGRRAAPLGRDEHFIFSYEAALLRSGGISGAGRLARQLATGFSSPRVMITVREPAALLVSAYFQSLRLRRSAMGFSEGEPVHRGSVRFMHFEEWWNMLAAAPEVSLAGLLDYPQLKATLEKELGPDRVVFLKLEEIAGKTASCREKLLRLGFGEVAIDAFLNAPPENTGEDKKLQRERPLLHAIGRRLDRAGLSRPLSLMLRSTALMRPAEKLLYGGRLEAKSRIDPRLLDDIREKYRPGFESLA